MLEKICTLLAATLALRICAIIRLQAIKPYVFLQQCHPGLVPGSVYAFVYSRSSSKTSSSSVYSGPINLSSETFRIDPSTVVTDSMTDSRDGQTYRTVTIGTQTWMAQNLNYKSVNSYCYNDSSKYCDQYGCLYTWAAAMDSAGSRDVNGKGCGFESACSPKHPVRGVCPEGWHLPDSTEWMTFINSVGSVAFAGKFIKAGNWYMQGSDKNSYYFTALPSGNRTCEERSINEGTNAFIWSSTEKDSKIDYNLSLFYRSDRADLSSSYKCIGISVRCLKD